MQPIGISSLPVQRMSLWEILRQQSEIVEDITTPNQFSEFYSTLYRSLEVKRLNARSRVILLQNAVKRIRQEIDTTAMQIEELRGCLRGIANSPRSKRWMQREPVEIAAALDGLTQKHEEMQLALVRVTTSSALALKDWETQERQLYMLDRANDADKLKELAKLCREKPPEEIIQWSAYAPQVNALVERYA